MTSSLQKPDEKSMTLVAHAQDAMSNAYVPYSSFRVGAALELSDGSIITGCNVENAAYSMTICAERTALVRMIAEGKLAQKIMRIAVYVDGNSGSPCGACRQMLAEFAQNADITFIQEGSLVMCKVSELLPSAFLPEALEK